MNLKFRMPVTELLVYSYFLLKLNKVEICFNDKVRRFLTMGRYNV
jgi:hypothetical protein